MLEESVIPLEFGQGLDTKTDPKKIKAGKFLRLENGTFTNPHRVGKRNGYTNLSGLVEPQLLHEYNDELIAADQNQIKSYSPTSAAWFSKGPYTSVEMTPSTVDQEHADSGYVDNAVLGQYVLNAWTTQTPVGAAGYEKSRVFASVVDTSSGTTIYRSIALNTAFGVARLSPIKCVLLGGTTLAAIYINDPDGINFNLVSRTFSIVSGSVVEGAETTISTGGSIPQFAFDVVATPTGAVVVYPDAAGIVVIDLNTSGVRVNQTAVANVLYTYPVHINTGVGAAPGAYYIWVYFYSTAGQIKYLILDSSFAVVLATTTAVAGIAGNYPSNLSSAATVGLTQTLLYGHYISAGTEVATAELIDITKAVNLNSAGAVVWGPNIVANGVTPFSRTFNVTQFSQTRTYVFMAYRGLTPRTAFPQPQPTIFLVCIPGIDSNILFDPEVVARFASGLANNQALVLGPGITSGIISWVPNASADGALKFLYSYGASIQEFVTDYYVTSGFADNLGDFVGVFSAVFDFNSANAYIAKNAGQLAITNGALLQQYDGLQSVEFGFHLFPEISTAAYVAGGGGLTAAGKYGYLAIFQWTDAQGNLHQSAPSNPKLVTLAGGQNAVHLYVTVPYLTQKTDVSVAIYRTKANLTLYFLITDPVFVLKLAGGSAAAIVTFDDLLADSALDGNPIPYTSPDSAVLENSTPPPSMIMVAHNNRLWFVDSENPNTEWYTKSFEPKIGLSPSAFMTQQIDPKFGNITALAEMDEKIVTFKEDGIFVQSGDGVNDSGGGSTLSFPQFVPSDVGCDSLKSVVTTPQGILFHSPNGIYGLSRALQASYLGMEVEQYNAQVITSAILVPGKSQIRFLCSTGLTLVYDYIFGQWSTFTNHTGTSATAWQGIYVYSSGALVLKEVVPSASPLVAPNYSDNGTAFSLLLQTGWLAISSVQNFQRVRRFITLGDFTNGASNLHGVSVAAAYDFSTTFQPAVPYHFGVASASKAFQYRERLPIQKCDAISLLITELTTGDNLEYLDLTNMSFEAGLKKGVTKLAAAQSVG